MRARSPAARPPADVLPRLRRARDHMDMHFASPLELSQLADPPLDAEAAAFFERQLGKGHLGGLGLRVDDCMKTAEELRGRGVTLVQEPADRPYGIEAVIRDNSGNWLVLVEPKEFSPEDFA